LAHELAHLKRFDHLANLFQVALETLFFYHPVVHWISRDARNERELCCDALALRVTGGERRDFVAALANLEEFRADHAGLALAASGGVLVERAWFIAGAAPKHRHRQLRGNVALTLAIAVGLGLGWVWLRHVSWQQRIASLVASNNAAVMRFVGQDVPAPGLLPITLAPVVSRLAPAYYPTLVARQGDGATMPVAPVRVAAVGNPTLALDFARQRLAPVAAPVLSTREPEATTASADASAAPRPLRTVRPVYPSQALLTGVQGQVVVEFALDAAGIPHDLEVVGSSAGPFGAAALQALAGWRFAPPAVPGRRYRQAFTFRLGGEGAGDDAAVAHACFVTTGTHICRHVSGIDDRGVQVRQPNH
ncbi:MAG: TonB family protein, partial [Rhodanobacteraceae bacterium]